MMYYCDLLNFSSVKICMECLTLDQPTHVTVKCCGMKFSVQNDRNLNACIRETVYRVKDIQQLTPSSVQI